MADFGKPKNSIPTWQRTQKPLGAGNSRPPSDASEALTNGLGTTAKDNHEASNTDGSDVAAQQEHEASKAIPDSLQETEDPPNHVAKTDGTNTAAMQEFDASKTTPDALLETQSPPANTSRTDGSDIAAQQEFEASEQVIEQVRKFLTDPQVKDAPLEKKRMFLESKGVSKEIITEVLEVDSPAAFSAAEFQTSREVTNTRPQPQIELPPIVTYPEFLMQPQQPPPIVTIDRLVSAAYITGGIAATIYGLSKFIISPMAASLGEARHELASHTSEHLTTINDKLSGLVSTIPNSIKSKASTTGAEEFDDAESTVSDPTELFHRDIGTQTSPLPTPDEKAIPSSQDETETPLAKHEARLKIMHSHISELLEDSETNGNTSADIQTEIVEFKHYLDSMIYSSSPYQYMPGDTTWTPPDAPGGKKADDVVKDFKAEIRGVKGVLLSAKRFPSATTVR